MKSQCAYADSMVDSRELVWSIEPVPDVRDISHQWNELNRRNANIPILDAEFFFLLAQHLTPRQLRYARCEYRGKTIASCLLECVRYGVWQTYQPSQAPIGAWVSDPFALDPGVTQKLVRSFHGLCLAIGISQADPAITDRPVAIGTTSVADYIDTARISIDESFEQYWNSRGKNLRHNLNRLSNKLEREGIAPRLVTVSDVAELGRAVDQFGLIESSGWKGREGTALHPSNKQGRFYRELMELFGVRKEAKIYQLFFDDDLVASDLCLHRDGLLVVLKTTYDERFSKTSPAIVMRKMMAQELFDSGSFRAIEFYGRAMPWHRQWTDEIRTMYHVTQYRYGLLRRLFSRSAVELQDSS